MSKSCNTTNQVIVGGGIIGCLLAIVHKDSSTILLDKNWDSYQKLAQQDFFVAISQENIKFIANLLNMNWQSLLQQLQATPVQHMTLFFDECNLELPTTKQNLASYIVSKTALHRILLQHILDLSNFQAIDANLLSYKKLDDNSNKLELAIDKAQTPITTNLLLGADGQNSWVRTLTGNATTHYECHHSACIAQVELQEKQSSNIAWQLMSDQIIALLPTNSICNKACLIWSLPDSRAKIMAKQTPAQLTDNLNQILQNKLPIIKSLTEVKFFPLKHFSSQQVNEKAVVLLGDAAQVVHPLAGQGLNLGIYDVKKWHQAWLDNQTPNVAISQFAKSSKAHKSEVALGVYGIYKYSNLNSNIRKLFAPAINAIGVIC